MKVHKILIYRYNFTGEPQSEITYPTLGDAVSEYDRLYHEHEKNPSFHEWDNGKGFSIDGLTVELTTENDDPAPTGFSGIGLADIKPLIYLASPYTGNNEEENFKKVAKKAAELMCQGLTIFSPISMCHPMAVYGKIPGDWDFWKKFDTAYISCCNKLIVYQLPGWEKSKGVQSEIKIAQEMGIPIEYLPE